MGGQGRATDSTPPAPCRPAWPERPGPPKEQRILLESVAAWGTGFVFLYPSRAGAAGGAEDEGIEVCVCLEETCQNRLMEDQLILEYAEVRGL